MHIAIVREGKAGKSLLQDDAAAVETGYLLDPGQTKKRWCLAFF
jgi:hypothetical protein